MQMMVQIPIVVILGLTDWVQDVYFIISSWITAGKTSLDTTVTKSDYFVAYFTAIMLVIRDHFEKTIFIKNKTFQCKLQ